MELITNNTYNKKEAKEVIINIHGNEKNHITVILAITGKGNKLPPVLIFKGKNDKTNEKRYNRLDVVKQKRIYIFCQDNGWVNEFIFKKWIAEIYLDHQKRINKKCLLLLDKAPSHISPSIINYFQDKKIEYSFIPGKLTRFLQLLDIGLKTI